MELRNLWMVFERVVQVNAPMWTWEVSIPFDSEISAGRLVDLFRRDFPVASQKGNPLFLKMIAFNSDSGRKIRYLVVLAEPATANLNGSCDRVLPSSIMLYGIADEVARGTDCKICECVSSAEKMDGAGNALFSFLQGSRLLILVFWGGRLCHWSEEVGYEEGFGGKAYEDRMERFRKFLAQDEYFSQGGLGFSEYRQNMEPRASLKTANAYFRRAARDPFWRNVDLNRGRRLRPLTKKTLFTAFLVAAVLALVSYKNIGAITDDLTNRYSPDVSVDIALSFPPFAPSGEPRNSLLRDSLFRKNSWSGEKVKIPMDEHSDVRDMSILLPKIKLRSIVEGVVFQGFVDGNLKWLRIGDSVGVFEVKSIGRDCVVLEGGGRSVEVKHE